MEYCNRYFPLIKPQYDKNGKIVGSKLEQYIAVEKMSGIKVPELQLPEVDPTIMYLLEMFYNIKTSSDIPLSYHEINSYRDLMCIDLEPKEVQAIIQIDRSYSRGIL